MSRIPPKHKLVVFDLDGTLIDSRMDLVASVNATRRHYSMGDLDGRVVESFTGDGATALIERSMGPDFDPGQLAEALRYFIVYYREHSLDHTVLYPGVREVVQALSERGVLQAILTNKPVRISKEILTGLELSSSFLQIYGGGSFDTKKPDPEGLLQLMGEAGVSPSETLMVGDSGVDIQTARNAGCQGCGVTFGFQPETLAGAAPDFMIDRLPDLLPIVLDGRAAG